MAAKPRRKLPLVVYIAGPYRAANSWDVEQNIRRAETLALAVWRAGFAALCPHTNTRFYDGAAPDYVWLTGDLALLQNCDALLTVDGWERSTGTQDEIAFARDEQHMPVFHRIEDLIAWRDTTHG